MNQLQLGAFQLTWLDGGVSQLDGGAMFGVVPKPLWSKRYPNNENNQIPLRADPILIQANGKKLLLESGLGKDRLTDKQKRNFGVIQESNLEGSLAQLGLNTDDIDIVLMTHLHYDHANGLVSNRNGELSSTFSKAAIYVQQMEWDEMRNPNIRSRNTYWEENWRPIEGQVVTYGEETTIIPGIGMYHTGGHTNGHAVIRMQSGGEVLLHLADLLPTHAHQNPLWVMAYDDYPMDSIYAKERWIKAGIEANAWFSFYHDAMYRAIKWGGEGQIVEKIEVDPT